jgi:hemerythrin-like domain-containing protein
MPSDNNGGVRTQAGDILELLKRDHERVDRLLDEIETTDGNDERRRSQLFAQVAAELEVHSDSEDQVVYAALESRAGFEELIDDARGEHEHIEQMVEELDQLEVTAGDWIDKVHELRQLVRHHVDEEEGTLFPKMREALDSSERSRLADAFVVSKDIEEEEVSGERPVPPVPAPDSQRDIESMSKKELYELARNRHIEGRSAMTKAELVNAIRAAR